MVQQNEVDRLKSAWNALSGQSDENGWQTISIEKCGHRQLLAGRHFPDNMEAILAGFHLISIPADLQLPNGQGFLVEQIKQRISDDSRIWIALSRQPAGQLEMFSRMAEDVVNMLEEFKHLEELTLFNLFLGRVRAWQEFMRRGRIDVLNQEAEIGLIGELNLFRLLLKNGLEPKTVVNAWQGPFDGLHDFVFGSGALEVKTTVSHNGFLASVNSLDQLDTSIASPLFVVAIRFALHANGETLPEVVEDILFTLDDRSDSKGMFQSLILRAGFFSTFSEHYKRRFLHSSTRIIFIDSEFPSLTKNKVDYAIKEAQYKLDLDLVSGFNLEIGRALQQLGVIE